MAASLWSVFLGQGLRPSARACRCSQGTLGLYALRAGRLSSVRHNSTATLLKDDLPSSSSPSPELEDPVPASEEKLEPNAGQPTFESLRDAVSPRTLKALIGEPFRLKYMSPVQAEVLPLLPDLVKLTAPGEELKGPRDLMVKARTGTGKTLAFLIPAVESRLNALRAHAEQVARDTENNSKTVLMRAVNKYAKQNVGALIISPTRELATQIANEAIKLTQHHDMFEVRLFVGGLPKRKQQREWNLGRRDIIVATPGRLLDFIETEPGFKEELQTTETFILDEADTLLEMGFREDIQAISDHLKGPPERQTFMFSATMSKPIQQVVRAILSPNHKFVNCVPDDSAPTHSQIPQYYTAVPNASEQLPHILRLIAEDQLENPGTSKVLIFLPTTRMVKLYSTLMTQLGRSVLPAGERTRFAEMHSKKAMTSRMNTSDWFRRDTSGATVMLTSDVSARGVDYPGVTRVIQVGVPASGDGYIHRVGRTGRGRNMASGRADLVLLPYELGFLSWNLKDVPIKEYTTNQAKENVTQLAAKYEDDPKAFFPTVAEKRPTDRQYSSRRPPGFPPAVSARLEDIEKRIEEQRPALDTEEINETMGSMLSFYSSNQDALRVQRNVIIAGVQEWAEALAGEPLRLRIPREYANARAGSRRPENRRSGGNRDAPSWSGRGSTRAKEQRKWESSPTRSDNEDDGAFDFDADISGSGRPRRGRSEDGERRSGGYGDRKYGGERRERRFDDSRGYDEGRKFGGDRRFGGDRGGERRSSGDWGRFGERSRREPSD